MTITETTGTVEVGDIFKCRWGYDQTNIDYYEAVAISKTGRVKVQAIRSRYIEQGGPYDTVGPLPGHFVGEPTGYKIADFWEGRKGGIECAININTFSSACRVDADSTAQQTGRGYGH